MRNFSGFTTKNIRNQYGYLSQIVDNTSGAPYWTANARDAELHLVSQTAGNGLVTTQSFDPNTGMVSSICASNDSGTGSCDGNVAGLSYGFDTSGNLMSRTDMLAVSGGQTETMCYDRLDRLVNFNFGSACTGGGKTIAYDSLGNITSKGSICSVSGCFAYGVGAGPHALTSLTAPYQGVSNPLFAYDANGNQTCMYAPGGAAPRLREVSLTPRST